jgi:phosphoserine phosphatase
VHAVELRFDPAGAYAGFDESSPLARSGGKAEACRRVLEATPGWSAIVGDGQTDLEARPPCDVMVGFGGVVAREAVRQRADVWVEQPTLLPVLRHLLTDDELAGSPMTKEHSR